MTKFSQIFILFKLTLMELSTLEGRIHSDILILMQINKNGKCVWLCINFTGEKINSLFDIERESLR